MYVNTYKYVLELKNLENSLVKICSLKIIQLNSYNNLQIRWCDFVVIVSTIVMSYNKDVIRKLNVFAFKIYK